MGQARFVTSNTSTSLTVDVPWQVTPDATSVYAITPWAAYQVIILNNTIGNSATGVEFWEGAYQCSVDTNTITNTLGILLRAEDINPADWNFTGPEIAGRRHAVAWDNWILGNNVKDTLGIFPPRISAYGCYVDGVSYGNLVFINLVSVNYITECTPAAYFPDGGGFVAGYYSFNLLQGVALQNAPMGWQGTIFNRDGGNVNPLFYYHDCWPLSIQ